MAERTREGSKVKGEDEFTARNVVLIDNSILPDCCFRSNRRGSCFFDVIVNLMPLKKQPRICQVLIRRILVILRLKNLESLLMILREWEENCVIFQIIESARKRHSYSQF